MARILIVEDSPTIISSLEAMLRQYNHTIYVTRDGLAAISALRAFAPDVVLLDIMLPHIDGLEICKIIRKRPAYDKMVVVMMTGIKDAETMKLAMDLGANHYVIKPFKDSDMQTIFGHSEPKHTPAPSYSTAGVVL